ncbi:MAG: hypothetical protein ABL927_07615 [Bdellovibrionales bacterium]
MFLLSIGLIATGCTSAKNQDADTGDAAELTGDAPAASEDDSVASEDAPAASDTAAAEDDFGADPVTESAEAATAESSTKNDSPATDDFDSLDNTVAQDPAEAPVADANQDLAATTEDSSKPAEDLAAGDAATTEAPPADVSAPVDSSESQGLSEATTPAPVSPLQKMMTVPYKKNGVIVNALYVARKGDTLIDVSQKIYGSDKTKELKKINPTFARREMKVGDKVYYNSPVRAEDNTSVMTYYEDMGLAPESYVAQAGDNIHSVAKNLFGDANSWKELWATNPEVESKGELLEGTKLRYWSSVPNTAAPAMASAADTAMPTQEAPPPMPDEVAQQAPPPSATGTSESAEMTPPPPPSAEMAPPPPAPMEAAPPPPPPQVAQQKQPIEETSPLGTDPDQMMALAAGAVLLLAAITMFIVIRKKRARRNAPVDFQTATHTHIE